MQRIETKLQTVNLELLDQQVKAVLPEKCNCIIKDRYGIFIELTDEATAGDIAQALAIAQKHNSDDKTPDQQKLADEKTDFKALMTVADKDLTLPMLANALRFMLRQLGQG